MMKTKTLHQGKRRIVDLKLRWVDLAKIKRKRQKLALPRLVVRFQAFKTRLLGSQSAIKPNQVVLSPSKTSNS